MFVEHEAPSYNPRPDVKFGQDGRNAFLSEVKSIAADQLILCAPGDGRHAGYIQRAEANARMVADGACAEWFQSPLPKRSTEQRRRVPVTPPEQSRIEQNRAELVRTFDVVELLPMVRRVVKRIKRSLPYWAEEDELVGCASLALWQKGTRMTAALARKIIENTIIDVARKEEVRRRDRYEPEFSREAPEPSDSDNVLDINEKAPPAGGWFMLWEAIKALPYRQREAVILGYWAGYDAQDTATLMGIGRRAAQRLLARGAESVKNLLGDVRFKGVSNDYTDVEWFRVYVTLKDDPKVQLIPADLFRFLVNVWCLARQNNGLLPEVGTLAFQLRVSEAEASDNLRTLLDCGLIDKTGSGLTPHNWNERQYVSDNSTSRVRRHRGKVAALPKRFSGADTPVTIEEWDEWRCFVLWVVGGLNPMDGSMAAEVKDALDARCPRFLESETAYFTERHNAGEYYDWPLDFITGLMEWGCYRVFAGRAVPSALSVIPEYRATMRYVLGQNTPCGLDEWRNHVEDYPNLTEWREAAAVCR